MKRLRRWISFVTIYPIQLLVVILGTACSWSIRGLTALRQGIITHLYVPVFHARRWVAGEPLYKPEDTALLGLQPRTADDKRRLEAWAKENGRMVFESMDGQVFLSCGHDHDGPCAVSLTELTEEEEVKAANAMAKGTDGGTSLEVDEKTGALRVVKHPPKTVAGEIDTGDHDDRPRAA
jgi:hypothetical protein